MAFSVASSVTSFSELAIVPNGANTQVNFGANPTLLCNYSGLSAANILLVA